MKKVVVTMFACACLAGLAVFIGSCMDRQPGPVCPVPTEITIDENMVKGFDGVDLLVVIDNSGSMAEEQAILATGFITLINSLAKPTSGWLYPPVENMRVAIVSSDLGLQYGDEGDTEGCPGDVTSCEDADGENGEFKTEFLGTTVNIMSGEIACDEDDPVQCPPDFTCEENDDEIFVCESPSGGIEAVNCPAGPGADWFETTTEDDAEPNPELALQVSCMSNLGTGGCGMEQQLQAAVKGLTRYKDDFMKENHLLAVLVVSDEEDCSIEDPGLFETDEWNSGTSYDEDDPSSGLLNTACNYPEENEDEYLFPEIRFWEEYVKLKDDMASAVIFAAIVGVPTDADVDGTSPCQGRGDALSGCLENENMQIEVEVFEDGDIEYKHFANACVRENDEGEYVTEARPGRRYVQVAQSFGTRGYVYSICNEDWSPAMEEIAKVIAENLTPQCYDKHLEWQIAEDQPESCDEDAPCGMALCDMVAIFTVSADDDILEEGNPCPFDVEDEDRIQQNPLQDETGQTTQVEIYCPLPKLPAEIDCELAKERWDEDDETVGWYYCQSLGKENFDEACINSIDDDGDGKIDCEDEDCQDCIDACPETGTDVACENTCMNEIKATKAALSETRGAVVAVQCLQQFSFEDENCQENTHESCNDGFDNDGNKIWDCEADMSGDNPHFPDPHCCPMTVEVTVEGDVEKRTCKVDTDAFKDNCPDTSVDDENGACKANANKLVCDLSD